MIDTIKAGQFKLVGKRGATCASTRSVASVLGLNPNARLQLSESYSRECGTNHKKDVFRIRGTEDAVVITRYYGTGDNIARESARLAKSYFSEHKAYAQACGQASRKYRIPFNVVLSIGPENAKDFAAVISCLRGKITKEDAEDLSCCTELCNDVLSRLLPENWRDKISNWSQVSSKRVATYLASI